MTFREQFQTEIQTQGISVADVAKASGISKGAIYNILNGTTEEDRIRPSTRHALAQGCRRSLEIDSDGTHRFVLPRLADRPPVEPPTPGREGVRVVLVNGRTFRADSHVADIFNWLNELEETDSLAGLDVVDRVYQKRSEFLSLVMENDTGEDLRSVEIPISIAYDSGPNKTFSCRIPQLDSGAKAEMTVQVGTGPPYIVKLQDGWAFLPGDIRGSISTQTTYRHRGSL